MTSTQNLQSVFLLNSLSRSCGERTLGHDLVKFPQLKIFSLPMFDGLFKQVAFECMEVFHFKISINQDALKKIFAVILFYTAIKMLNWDVVIVKWVKNIFA